MGYKKVQFTNGADSTAGLILDSEDTAGYSVSDYSHLFPYSEIGKMHQLNISGIYATWEEAFYHQF